MDLVLFGVVFALGAATGVVVAAMTGRLPREPSPPLTNRERRARRIDATEAYLTTTVAWLFNRALGNREAFAERNGQIIGVPFGQVDLRLLSDDNALEYAALCRWLWGQSSVPVPATEAVNREQGFRTRLRAHFDRQRALAEAGEPAMLLRPDAAAIVNEVVDEVMQYRAEQAESATAARS